VPTVVHLVRHGKVHNPDNVRYGRAPGFHLSTLGCEQAREAGQWLRAQPIAGVVSSPLERAVETAEIIARELGIAAVGRDDRLIEAHNELDGLHRYAFLNPLRWGQLRNPFKPSWGEPFVDIAARMRAAIDELRDAHAGEQVVAVAHQAPIWIVRQSYERRGPPWLGRVHCTQGSVTSLRFDGDAYSGYSYWAPSHY
jgi:broad specificity phosphatase PhoE